MSRKDQKKQTIEKYIDIRSSIYDAITYSSKKLFTSLNTEKHDTVNHLSDLLNMREKANFFKNFQEIISSKIPGCSSTEMKTYIRNNNENKYHNCLQSQKEALMELVDNTHQSTYSIVDIEGGILGCDGAYNNGVCHPE